MASTNRLYYTDSSLLDFTATVISIKPAGDLYQIELDRTAFYPTGGGQPHDTGTLDQSQVVDVLETDSGSLIHVVKGAGEIKVGQVVRGQIDRDRRLDHMQQHSGQHILSQAFVRACGAKTRSFHLGANTSTIDIELASPTDEQMRAAEEIANQVVFDDRPVRVHMLSEEEAARLPLRKESTLSQPIRVIEIEDFDWSPCGGTHALRTGQVGLIAIKSYERLKKDLTRVEFVCGRRALVDYRSANQAALAVASVFSVARESAPEAVARAIRENKLLRKRVRELFELTAAEEAARLLSAAYNAGQFKIVRAEFDGRPVEELKLLAARIVQRERAIALLGTKHEATARLVFARSDALTQNMAELVSQSSQILGGGGGGKADLAQGGGPNLEKLGEAIQLAYEKALSSH
jgi:alanyl-tRNA synthetase